MTQKPSSEKLVSPLLRAVDPRQIADQGVRQTVELLLNLIEELNTKIKGLESENQRLRDENKRLKGEQGKPDIKAQKKGLQGNHSSEKERQTPKKHTKSSKNESIKIDREEILEYPLELLPADAQFKGYEEVIVQDITLTTNNVLFRKQKYYSPSEGKTYLAELPNGYKGEFGPGIKALVVSLYYGGNMTQGKLLEFLEDIGISISAGHLSNRVLKGLQNQQELEFILNPLTFSLLETFQLPIKWKNSLKLLPQETVFNSTQFNTLLDNYLPKLGSQQRIRVLEAAAIAYYHQQTDWPVVHTLVCDDAPQFKLLTDDLALCWVHEGRHYKKLSPLVACHQEALDKFLDDFWDYYRDLLAYRDSPSEQTAEKLQFEFCQLFGTNSGYQQLDERKQLTAAKMSELLRVLEHPELPLHNNPAELAARTMVQRRNISYATQTTEGTKAWDTFMSLVATTRKLGISFFEYVRERISEAGKIPSLATIIREKSFLNPFGWSWQPE